MSGSCLNLKWSIENALPGLGSRRRATARSLRRAAAEGAIVPSFLPIGGDREAIASSRMQFGRRVSPEPHFFGIGMIDSGTFI